MTSSPNNFAHFQSILLNVSKSEAIDSGDFNAAARLVLESAHRGLRVRRASIWSFNRGTGTIRCRLLVDARDGVIDEPLELDQKTFPRYFDALDSERNIVAHSAWQDPRTSELTDIYLKPLGVTSMLDSPIRSRGRMSGILCCEHVGPQRRWSMEEQIFCASLADLLSRTATALARNSAEIALRDSEERFRGAFDFSIVPMVLLDRDGEIIKVNPALCGFLGYDATETPEISLPLLFNPGAARDLQTKRDQLLAGETDSFSYEGPILHRSGKVLWAMIHASTVFSPEGRPRYVMAVIQDITHIRQLSSKLSHQATHDSLTDLVNRAAFESQLERVLASSREDDSEHALLYIDLDQFKIINDTCGHSAGDELLRQLSARLRQAVRKEDIVARLGGDEFGILLEHCSLTQARMIGEAVMGIIRDVQFGWKERSFQIGASIGLVTFCADSASVSELLQHADIACFAAKDAGRNRLHIYEADDTVLVKRHSEMHWVSRIIKALQQNRLCLYAQPILSLSPNGVAHNHVELLLRMKDESGEIIPPGAFLPAAERYNVIDQVDRWVVRTAFALIRNHASGLPRISVFSINLSGQSIADAGFMDFIIAEMNKQGIDSRKVCFEITETAAITNLTSAMRFITTLRGLGFQFALDDFGSGLSSFSYLRSLPVNFLKIDGIFVKDIVHDPIDRGIVKTINELGQLMGMETIAEFVESNAVRHHLEEIGVNFLQGHGIGEPVPVDRLTEFFSESTAVAADA